jgi:hypothetical protein
LTAARLTALTDASRLAATVAAVDKGMGSAKVARREHCIGRGAEVRRNRLLTQAVNHATAKYAPEQMDGAIACEKHDRAIAAAY